jgi:hypothetical protein
MGNKSHSVSAQWHSRSLRDARAARERRYARRQALKPKPAVAIFGKIAPVWTVRGYRDRALAGERLRKSTGISIFPPQRPSDSWKSSPATCEQFGRTRKGCGSVPAGSVRQRQNLRLPVLIPPSECMDLNAMRRYCERSEAIQGQAVDIAAGAPRRPSAASR